MSFSRPPISVFIAITPTSLALALLERARQLGLQRDEVEGVAQAVVEVRVLAEAVGDQHDVDQVRARSRSRGIRRAGCRGRTCRGSGSCPAALARSVNSHHSGFCSAPDVVDRVVEVDVEPVGLQAPQAALERRHHLVPRVAARRPWSWSSARPGRARPAAPRRSPPPTSRSGSSRRCRRRSRRARARGAPARDPASWPSRSRSRRPRARSGRA